MKFTKMHGLGNDFVVVDHRRGDLHLDGQEAKALADRRYGVGCDQILELVPAGNPKADVMMLVHNADGSRAGTCGNGLRCVAWWLHEEAPALSRFMIETGDSLVEAVIVDGMVQLDMGLPDFGWETIPLAHEVDVSRVDLGLEGLPAGYAVSVGNPHVVFEVQDAEVWDVDGYGPKAEKHALFPQRVNVEFVTLKAKNHVRMRVWERGAGRTLACGSGATAVAAIFGRQGRVNWPLRVELDGGDLFFREENGRMIMTGPAVRVFEGVYKKK